MLFTSAIALSISSGNISPGSFISSSRAFFTAASTTDARPVFLSADVSTTGQPRTIDSLFVSIFSPRFSMRSAILSAMTTGMPVSMTWVVRYRLRSMFVASTRSMMTSGLSSIRYLRLTTSSRVYGEREYMPGRSVMIISSPFLSFSFPSFFSTVTPGQFPTYWLAPVRALNIVVLPQFGFPTRAILILIPPPYLTITHSASFFLTLSS